MTSENITFKVFNQNHCFRNRIPKPQTFDQFKIELGKVLKGDWKGDEEILFRDVDGNWHPLKNQTQLLSAIQTSSNENELDKLIVKIETKHETVNDDDDDDETTSSENANNAPVEPIEPRSLAWPRWRRRRRINDNDNNRRRRKCVKKIMILIVIALFFTQTSIIGNMFRALHHRHQSHKQEMVPLARFVALEHRANQLTTASTDLSNQLARSNNHVAALKHELQKMQVHRSLLEQRLLELQQESESSRAQLLSVLEQHRVAIQQLQHDHRHPYHRQFDHVHESQQQQQHHQEQQQNSESIVDLVKSTLSSLKDVAQVHLNEALTKENLHALGDNLKSISADALRNVDKALRQAMPNQAQTGDAQGDVEEEEEQQPNSNYIKKILKKQKAERKKADKQKNKHSRGSFWEHMMGVRRNNDKHEKKSKHEKHFEKIQNDHQAHMDRIRNHHRLIQEQQRQHQQKQHHRFGHRHEL